MDINMFNSKILDGISQQKLIDLCEFSTEINWKLLYRASMNGFSDHNFHSKCDNQPKTLTIIKTTNGSIFGGFREKTWPSLDRLELDPNSFIFSLINQDSNPIKMKISRMDNFYSKLFYNGPTFGDDFCIESQSNLDPKSFSNLGRDYKHPTYDYGTDEAKCFLAGSDFFQVSEIEIFKAII
jgi:hypothetical protein